MIERLPEDAQTLHAEMLALLLDQEAERDWSHLSGSFSIKVVKGAEYVYFQYSDPGGAKRQFSIGRRDSALDAVIEGYGQAREDREADMAQLQRLAGLLRSAGVALLPHGPARVIRALADAGVFRVGGVLVGSYAFQVLGNLLGLRWSDASWRTQDVDIAGHLQVALPGTDADIPKALESLQMGFVPVPQLDPRHASTSFRVRGKPLRVDLITPGTGADQSPLFIPRFQAAAAPIKHLSLLMENAQPAAAIDGRTATLVVVPTPARYALHKLYVSQTRALPQQTKGGKDLHQAALLLEALALDRPDDLGDTARAFVAAGKSVCTKIGRAAKTVRKTWPDSEGGVEILLQGLDQA